MTLEEYKKYYHKKYFAIRGLPFSKKMWREGYNRALDDLLSTIDPEHDSVILSSGSGKTDGQRPRQAGSSY